MPSNDSNLNPSGHQLELAFASKREIFARMPEDQINRNPGLDPLTAVAIADGAMPRIKLHRHEIEALFGESGAEIVDDLPTVVLATHHAINEHDGADAKNDLGDAHDDLLVEHRLILTDGDSLANRGLIDRKRIDPGRPIQGYRATIQSTFYLINVFRENWSIIEGKTPITLEDLDRIAAKARAMSNVLNTREAGNARLDALEMKHRAVSYLMRRYEEVRRMIVFLRWFKGDADDIAPTLYTRRRTRSGSTEPTSPAAQPQPQPQPQPDPTPVVNPVITGPNNGGAPFTS